MKSSIYISLLVFVFALALAPMRAGASTDILSNIVKCKNSLAQCYDTKDACVEKLDKSREACGNRYEISRTRCDRYEEKAYTYSPTCQKRLETCETRANSSKDPAKALTKCQTTYNTCQQRGAISKDRDLERFKTCKEKASERKKTCDEKFSRSYPSKISSCTSRAGRCVSSVSRRCGF